VVIRLLLPSYGVHSLLHSLPTRRSSDLGQMLASGSFDHTVRVWDIANEACIQIFAEHTSTVIAVAWSPDGKDLNTRFVGNIPNRSEEHTSELQSREKLVCRPLLEIKKTS